MRQLLLAKIAAAAFWRLGTGLATRGAFSRKGGQCSVEGGGLWRT